MPRCCWRRTPQLAGKKVKLGQPVTAEPTKDKSSEPGLREVRLKLSDEQFGVLANKHYELRALDRLIEGDDRWQRRHPSQGALEGSDGRGDGLAGNLSNGPHPRLPRVGRRGPPTRQHASRGTNAPARPRLRGEP